MQTIGKGWIRDTEEQRAMRPLARGLLGAGPLRLPSEASVRHDIVRIRTQRSSNGCVGAQLTRATDLRLAAINAFVEEHSLVAAYTMGRQWEVGEGGMLVDEGSQPSLVVEACTEFGLPKESDWPMPSNDIDLVDFLAKPVPFDILEKASALHPVAHLIDGAGESRLHQIRHALASGYPVIFGTEVDKAFEKYNGKGYAVPAGNQIEGGHMLGLDGYEGDDFLGWNSWDEDWGKFGYWTTKEDFLLDPRAGDFYAISVTGKNPKKISKEEE